MYHFHPAILAVSRQINHEAGQTLRENLFVKYTTMTSQYEMDDLQFRGLPIVAEGDSASRVTYSASELTMIRVKETCDSWPLVHMFAGDDMTTFCRILSRRGLFGTSLSIAITGTAKTTTSKLKLLEPFRRLNSIGSVRINAQIDVEYKMNLIAKMSEKKSEVNHFVQEMQNTIEEGDQAASVHDFSTAISRYERTFEDNQDYIAITTEWDNVLKKGRFSGQTYHTAFVQTRLALNIKLANTYLRLKNHTRAHQWISLALAQINPFGQLHGAPPSGAKCASIYSIAAQASEGLGLVQRAVDEMKEAVRHDPGDSNLITELVRLKRKMQSRDEDLEVL